MTSTTVPPAVSPLLCALEARDLEAVHAAFTARVVVHSRDGDKVEILKKILSYRTVFVLCFNPTYIAANPNERSAEPVLAAVRETQP
jgi:hypothetical protein